MPMPPPFDRVRRGFVATTLAACLLVACGGDGGVDSGGTGVAPQSFARNTSSAAVDRHDTLTAAAPTRLAPDCASKNSGRFFIMRMRLDPLRKPRRERPVAKRFMRPSSSAHV